MESVRGKKKGIEGRCRQGREDEAAEDIKGWEKGHTGDGNCNSAARSVRLTCTDICIFLDKCCWCGNFSRNAECICMHMHTEATTHKQAHIYIKHHFKVYSLRRTVKESSLSKSISFAKVYHSPLLSLIHLLIPLFLNHFIQMFPELVLVHGRLMSCWGLWQTATSFYPFTSCFVVCIALCPFSRFGSLCMECMWACLLCLCVCVLNLDHTVCLRMRLPQQHPPRPPRSAIDSPNPHISSCVFAIAASCSLPPHFFLFYSWGGTQNKGDKVAQFPPLGSHTPTETHSHSHTLSAHAQCLAPLCAMHMSLSSSLMHRHTVELFKSVRWGAP